MSGCTRDACGFVVNNDGLNFSESANESTFLSRGEDGNRDQGGLLPGPSVECLGDQAFINCGGLTSVHRGGAKHEASSPIPRRIRNP